MKYIFTMFLLAGMLGAAAGEKKTIHFENGGIRYQYEMENGMLNGGFSGYYPGGKLKVQGVFVNNQKSGLWKFWDEQGILRSERQYDAAGSFTVLKEWNASGKQVKKAETDKKNLLLAKQGGVAAPANAIKLISVIESGAASDPSFFHPQGLGYFVIEAAMEGLVSLYADHSFSTPVDREVLGAMQPLKAAELRVLSIEGFSAESQSMQTQILGIGYVAEINGVKQEIGWLRLDDLTTDMMFAPIATTALQKIRAKNYNLNIAYEISQGKAVRLADGEKAALDLVDAEASAILALL